MRTQSKVCLLLALLALGFGFSNAKLLALPQHSVAAPEKSALYAETSEDEDLSEDEVTDFA